MDEYRTVAMTSDGFIELCAEVAANMIARLKDANILDDVAAEVLVKILAVYASELSDELGDIAMESSDAKNYA